MKTWIVEYTTNLEDRLTASVNADNYTQAYLEFTFRVPIHYIIVSLTERN